MVLTTLLPLLRLVSCGLGDGRRRRNSSLFAILKFPRYGPRHVVEKVGRLLCSYRVAFHIRYQASNWPRLFVDTWCNGNKPGCDNTAVGLAGSRILKVCTSRGVSDTKTWPHQVSCGDQHMLALTKEGEVFSWGYNGELTWFIIPLQ